MTADEVAKELSQHLVAAVETEEQVFAVLHAAQNNALLSHNLWVCRNEPEMFRAAAAGALNCSVVRMLDDIKRPPLGVLARAVGKVIVASIVTSRRASDTERERRLSACAQCPHLRQPPNTLLYTLAARLDDRVCGKCGCVVSKKASLANEKCPDRSASASGLSRWGDIID